MSDIVAVLVAAVRAFPENTAVARGDTELTYAELLRRIRATADRLGPDPGPVGVLTDRSPATVVALFGILAAGGAYCPVDPAFPAARQKALLEAAGCARVTVTRAGVPVPDGVEAVHLPASDAARATGLPDLSEPAAPGRPASTLFTSGSTGRPKPVVTPREAVTVSVASLRELFGLSTSDRVLPFASLNWDTCFEEVLPARGRRDPRLPRRGVHRLTAQAAEGRGRSPRHPARPADRLLAPPRNDGETARTRTPPPGTRRGLQDPGRVRVRRQRPRDPRGTILRRELRERFWAGRDRQVN